MQYLKVNQVVSQRPIFSFKASISRRTQQYSTKGGGGVGRQIQNSNQQIKLNAKSD